MDDERGSELKPTAEAGDKVPRLLDFSFLLTLLFEVIVVDDTNDGDDDDADRTIGVVDGTMSGDEGGNNRVLGSFVDTLMGSGSNDGPPPDTEVTDTVRTVVALAVAERERARGV